MTHSLDLEAAGLTTEWAVVAAVFAPSEIDILLARLQDDDLVWPGPRAILEAARGLRYQRREITPITLYGAMRAAGTDSTLARGLDDLITLHTDTPYARGTGANVDELARTATRRRLAHAGGEITRIALSTHDPDAALGKAIAALDRVATQRVASSDEHVTTVGVAAAAIWDRLCNGTPPPRLHTGARLWDDMTGGMGAGDLGIVAARPGHGKTAFAIWAACNIARGGSPVYYISLEMSAASLTYRLLGALAGVPYKAIQEHTITPEQTDRVARAVAVLADLPITVADPSSATTSLLRAGAYAWRSTTSGMALVIVDYLQLVRADRQREQRTLEVGEISGALKALARDLALPVIALSQLNRAVESRANKRPQLSDLRESGAIEQDSDTVTLIAPEEDTPHDQQFVDLIIAKNRNGPVGAVPMVYVPGHNQYYDRWGDK